MAYAAATFVYNESVNLPIWVKYYGEQFGRENLFVIDRSSDDGSTENLDPVNVVRIKREAFDEDAKTNLMSSFHAALTSVYDAVVITDCDEIVTADPGHFRNLADYIDKMDADYMNAVGVDVIHMITDEGPIDLEKGILSQRRFGRFHSPECKHLLSRIPIRWLPGLHSSNMAPRFDFRLVNFHLKHLDYGHAVRRQMINLKTIWSEDSLKHDYGAHHRYSLSKFVTNGFLVPIDLKNRSLIGEFEFSKEILQISEKTFQDPNGNFRIPMDISKMVRIPERFNDVF